MTKEQYLALKPNKKSLSLLRQEASKHYGGIEEINGEVVINENKPEFEFWSSASGSLDSWLSEPAKVRKILPPWSPAKHLESLKMVKRNGFRKTLVIPF